MDELEFEKLSSDEEAEEDSKQQNNQSSSDSNEDEDLEENERNFQDICSDEEVYENGNFLQYINHEIRKSIKERNFLVKQLKVKERRGMIFIDKVKSVVAAVQRESGKFDFLISWEYNQEDKLTPSTSLVRGSHFVFFNPLQYRRYVEKAFLEQAAPNENLIKK